MKNRIFLIAFILIGFVSNIFPQTPFRSGIFLHHSSGGVIWNSSNPDVPQLMSIYNTEHNYTGNNAVTMNIDSDHFPPLPDGNYYDTWHAVFVGQYDPIAVAQMQQYMQNNSIVVIKTCWGGGPEQMGDPADTLVIDDETSPSGRTYYRTKWHWRNIVRVMQSYPDNFFVIWTSIPLVPGPGYDGTLAHRFFTWAKDTLATGNDPIFGNFPDNVYVFDAFHLLADSSTQNWGMNPLYHDEGDNHPNEAGANAVAESFVWETFDAAIAYEGITPVELNLFNGNYEDGVVNLEWVTTTECNNFGFEVERRNDYSAYESIGFVNGNGTSSNRVTYNFVDDNLSSNRYYYRLKQIDLDGTFEYSSEVMIEIDGLSNFQLAQNYPNPFNPSTEINFTLGKPGNVTLIVYDYLGSVVATLADGFMKSGKYSVKFDAKDLTSGVYFYRIETENFTSARKMLLIK